MTTAVETKPEHVVLLLARKGAAIRTNQYAAFLSERGVRVSVIAANGQGWRKAERLHPCVEAYSLGRAENRVIPVRAYEVFVERLPRKILGRLESRLPGAGGRAAGKALKLQRRVARKLRKHVFWPLYRPVRPQLLRLLGMRRIAAIDLASADRVVCVDEMTVPLGWALTRRFPDLVVTCAMDRAAYEDRPVLAPALPWDPEDRDRPKRPPYTRL